MPDLHGSISDIRRRFRRPHDLQQRSSSRVVSWVLRGWWFPQLKQRHQPTFQTFIQSPSTLEASSRSIRDRNRAFWRDALEPQLIERDSSACRIFPGPSSGRARHIVEATAATLEEG
jgi:hypothetical protein